MTSLSTPRDVVQGADHGGAGLGLRLGPVAPRCAPPSARPLYGCCPSMTRCLRRTRAAAADPPPRGSMDCMSSAVHKSCVHIGSDALAQRRVGGTGQAQNVPRSRSRPRRARDQELNGHPRPDARARWRWRPPAALPRPSSIYTDQARCTSRTRTGGYMLEKMARWTVAAARRPRASPGRCFFTDRDVEALSSKSCSARAGRLRAKALARRPSVQAPSRANAESTGPPALARLGAG